MTRSLRILVTGNRGFVGTETCKLLKAQGHEVIGYDIMDGYDIRDRGQVEAVVNRSSGSYYGSAVDRILHLAAIARFDEADSNPVLTHETNVLGTMNIVEVAKKYHIPLVYASTGSAIMPLNAYDPPYTEEIRPLGNSVYGCSKALAELYVAKHTPHITLRYAHLYGAEKRHHGLIGGFLSRIEHDMQPELYGGQQTNSFLYIPDVAAANLAALEAPWDAWNQTYNIGSNEELSARSAGEMICKVFDYKGEIKVKGARTVDASRFQFDISKAKHYLGWEPKYDFEAGLTAMRKEMDERA